MVDDSSLRDRLARFGFSEKEVDVYLALVERGRAKPNALASAAGVSSSYTYEVLDRLEGRNLAVVEDHRSPTLVRATPPDRAFAELSEELDDIQSAVEQRYQQPDEESPSLRVVQSRQTLVRRLRALISTAESEIILSLPRPYLSAVADDLRSAVTDGTFVLLLLSGSAGDIGPAGLEDVATIVRSIDGEVPAYAVTDLTRGLVAPASVLAWEHGDGEALEFTHRTIAALTNGAFFGMYCSADPVLLRRPRTPPQRYQAIRPAVYDAYIAWGAGATLGIRGSVHPSEDPDETVTIEGRVTDIRQSLIAPIDGDFIFENAFYVDTDEGEISIGGSGAIIEDYEMGSLLIYEL